MAEHTKEQQQIRRSMRWVVTLSLLYAAAGNAFLYSAYFYNGIVERSSLIGGLMIIAFAAPVVALFRNRHWYFPAFIFLFWIPFSVLLAFALYRLLPLREDDYFGMLLVYCLVIHITVVLLGIALGMLVNACLAVWSRVKAKIE
ncbi:hypothetical protein KP806_13815 [Paenibacillus sp. N4]|uniref:hypothetical protein n=1 Tax=Paenibacillus vietnamensis TaxID=2590547 RepID=UPI001CD0D834|nr:hypothetical protein [Paenibacillus vietnamensis]MCA0756128.1 hypothetical protein [Paenibacillus vietnamensis]